MEENRPVQQPYVRTDAAPAAKSEAAGVDDGELLRRSASGDTDAQHALIERHGRYLYGVAHSLCGNAQDAEDLVQEALMGAFRTRFRGESALRTWLVQILVRRAGMLRRSRRGRPTVFSLEAQETAEPASASAASGGTAADARLDLTAMLQQLSPEHRQVIILRELQGMSYERISDALGVPRGTVESRLHRAREVLRKRFKGYL